MYLQNTSLSGSRTLAVIVPDSLSELVSKGEVVDRYYNPGNYFESVHIIMTKQDVISTDALQCMVGRAHLSLHHLATDKYRLLQAVISRNILLAPWIKQGLDLLRRIKPDLIRVHYGILEGYLARRAALSLQCKYVISIHTDMGKNRLFPNRFEDFAYKFAVRPLHRAVLKPADAIFCVYQSAAGFAGSCGAKNIHLIYNSVSRDIAVKENYILGSKPRVLTVNRMLPGKNPGNIIRAVEGLDCDYDVIGQGPLREPLMIMARELGLESKVRFIPSIPNKKLVASLAQYDIAVFHSDYNEVSKGVLEASLAGLPIVINRNLSRLVPEFNGDWLLLCEDTKEGYRDALGTLLADSKMRARLGRAARDYALAHWDPARMEQSMMAVYRELLEASRAF